jgi:hypothetical protein
MEGAGWRKLQKSYSYYGDKITEIKTDRAQETKKKTHTKVMSRNFKERT